MLRFSYSCIFIQAKEETLFRQLLMFFTIFVKQWQEKKISRKARARVRERGRLLFFRLFDNHRCMCVDGSKKANKELFDRIESLLYDYTLDSIKAYNTHSGYLILIIKLYVCHSYWTGQRPSFLLFHRSLCADTIGQEYEKKIKTEAMESN